MTPFEQALKLYGYGTTDFEHDLAAHIVSGYVVCTPEAIAFARPVRRDWTPDRFRDISDVEPLESADCWFIWLLCGKLEVAARWLPCPLPWLGFARRGKAVKFVDSGRIAGKLSQ